MPVSTSWRIGPILEESRFPTGLTAFAGFAQLSYEICLGDAPNRNHLKILKNNENLA
jgi:hypothetical protein